MKMRRLIETAVTMMTAATLAAAAGCGGSGDNASLVDLAIRWVAGTTPAGSNVDPRTSAAFLRFTASGPGAPDVTTLVDFGAGSGDLPAMSYGYDRQLTVEVCADSACTPPILARGRSVPTTIRPGDASKQLDVFVAPTNSFAPTQTPASENTAPLYQDLLGASITLLNDGRILIAGGASQSTNAKGLTAASDLAAISDKAQLYDPRTGEFADAGTMSLPRAYHQAVKLLSKANGNKVVLLGGYTKVGGGAIKVTDTVEIFDPDTLTFTQADSGKGLAGGAGRAVFSAGLAYADQDIIFLAGGVTDPPAAGGYWDLYVFNVGAVGHGKLGVRAGSADSTAGVRRWNHSMTYLPTYRKADGLAGAPAFVLMGGEDDTNVLSSVEAYTIDTPDTGFNVTLDESALDDPAADSGLPHHTLPGGGRTMHQAAYVPQQGIVYVIGGFGAKGMTSPLDRVDIYREGSAGFNNGEVLFLTNKRGAHSATVMDFNTIFIAGGTGEGGTALNSTEVVVETVQCDPPESNNCYYSPVVIGDSASLPVMSTARYGQLSVFDSTRRVFLAGGLSQATQAATTSVYYNPD